MLQYIGFLLLLQLLVGLIIAKQAHQHGHHFWLWWGYGLLLPILAAIHLTIILDDESEQSDEGGFNADSQFPDSTIEKHDRSCSCDNCIFEYKRFASHVDYYNPYPESYLLKKKRAIIRFWRRFND